MISHGVEQDQACDAPFSPEYAISGMRPSNRTSRPTPLMIAMELVSFLVVENLGDGESMRELNADARRSCGGIGGIERDAAVGGFFFEGAEGGSKEPRWGAVLLLFCREGRSTAACTMRCDAFNSVANWNGNGRKFYSLFRRVSLKLSKSCSPSSICTLRQQEIRHKETTDKIERHAPIFSTSTPPNHPSVHP